LNIEQLAEPTSRTPEGGDIFALKLQGTPFLFGRAIRPDVGSADRAALVYIYRNRRSEKRRIPNLRKDRLLLPPLLVDYRAWEEGYFETLKTVPLAPDDVRECHSFYRWTMEDFRDEDGKKVRNVSREDSDDYGVNHYLGVDMKISRYSGLAYDDGGYWNWERVAAARADSLFLSLGMAVKAQFPPRQGTILYRMVDNAYVRYWTDAKYDFYERGWLGGLVWAADDGAARRCVLSEIEQDTDPTVVRPPRVVLPGDQTYKAILERRREWETVDYRMDGAFLHRVFMSAAQDIYFRDPEPWDDEIPYAVDYDDQAGEEPEPPSYEPLVWAVIKRSQDLLGGAFERDHQLGDHWVAFYSAEHRLVVELDEELRDDPEEAAKKESWIRDNGYRFVRLERDRIGDDMLSYIPETIRAAIESSQ